MKYMLLLFSIVTSFSGCAQSSSKTAGQNTKVHVGGSCEGCEAIYESPISFELLDAVDTIPGFREKAAPLELSGIVYQRDGKTPAAGVVIYIYHTDEHGIYPTKGDEKGWAQRHGYLRGWVKTDEKGAYRFYTSRPASYPNSNNPQHIHVTLKEPGLNEYWIDEFHFTDDPMLTSSMVRAERKRGGSGILNPLLDKGLWKVKRDIVLGMNIEDYPTN